PSEGFIAQLNLRVGAQVVHPDRVLGRAALRTDEDVAIAVLDAHQRRFANGAGLVARVRDQNHRQAGVAQGRALGAAAALVELDLLSDPVARAWDIGGHGDLRIAVCGGILHSAGGKVKCNGARAMLRPSRPIRCGDDLTPSTRPRMAPSLKPGAWASPAQAQPRAAGGSRCCL